MIRPTSAPDPDPDPVPAPGPSEGSRWMPVEIVEATKVLPVAVATDRHIEIENGGE